MMKGARYFRLTEVNRFPAEPRQGRKELGWRRTAEWTELVRMMVRADLEAIDGV